MSILPDPVLSRLLVRIAETFRGLALGYELQVTNAIEPGDKARADGMREAFEEETAKREAE